MVAQKLPRRVGVTGGIACGKSTISKRLQEKGYKVIDADRLGHELLNSPNPTYHKVIERFGAEIVDTPGGPINRQKLAPIVFSDPKAKADLEAIVLPAIATLLEERIAALSSEPIVFVEVPLLFEAGLESKYDEIWLVLVDRATQLARLKARNGLSEEDALKRINAQWPQEKKAARSHRIIDNSGTVEETFRQVDQHLAEALKQTDKKQAPVALAEDPTRNSEYRALLKRFAELATDNALGQMGDVSSTHHKDATAEMTMRIDSCQDDTPSKVDAHQLRVRLSMCVKNNSTGGSSTDSSGSSACSCNCGAVCRKGCACSSQCGCACKSSSDYKCCVCKCTHKSDEECPCTTGGDTMCHPPNSNPRSKCDGKVLAFLGFLAFLFAVGVLTLLLWHYWSHGTTDHNPCHAPAPCVDPLRCRPILVLTDEQFEKLFLKSRCPTTPVTSPFEPPAPPPTPTPCPCPDSNPSATPPNFILPYLHNQVRFRVTEWTVRCRQNELGWVVAGRDNEGKLVAWMEFGAQQRFVQQWIVNYPDSRGSVYVDLFTAPNNFVGRTLYEYDGWSRLVLVKRLDDQQRNLTTATFERQPNGTLTKVVVRRFNEGGQIVDVEVSWNLPNATLMIAEFFQFELFGQFS